MHEIIEKRIQEFNPENVRRKEDEINKDPEYPETYYAALKALEAIRNGTGEVIGLEFDSVGSSISMGDRSEKSMLIVLNRGNGRLRLESVEPADIRVITVAVRLPN